MFNRRPRVRYSIDNLRPKFSPLESLESRQLFSSGGISVDPAVLQSAVTQGSVVGYTAAELKTAYGITGTGVGQTIAVVDAYNDPDLAADLAVFDKTMGLSTASLTVESQTGSTTSLPAANASWALEESLDVEWAHAVAPSARILLVEASNSSLDDLLTAVNLARSGSGVSVVSMSWGSTEFQGETSLDSYFTTPSGHSDVTFVASSGDNGYVEWPSASSNVIGVGGTTLTLSSSGQYSSEVGWHDSGGGYSEFEGEPAYQSAVQSTGLRSTPDVAYDANPSTGIAVYDSVTYDGQSGWFEIGGTSAGAPQWAGIVAIADQSRAASGKALLTSAGALNALYATYSSSVYTADFHDITSGTSFGKTAGSGYDLVTGLGTPKSTAIDSTLTSFTGSESTTVSSRAPTRFNPLGPAFDRAVAIASTDPTATFETDGGAFDGDASPSFSARPFLELIDQLDQPIEQLSVPTGLDQSIAGWTGPLQPAAAAAWGARPAGDERGWGDAAPAGNGLASTAMMGGGADLPPRSIILSTAAGSVSRMNLAPVGMWAMAESFFDHSALGQAATHFGFSMMSTLEDSSMRSFETAAAAAIMGAGFLWWWTEPEDEEDRKRQKSSDADLFSRKMIEMTVGGWQGDII